MYRVTINGEIVQETEWPNWVRWMAILESFVVCDEGKADAILIPGHGEPEQEAFYANIFGKEPARPEFPTAVVEKI